jgi:hypothetical protein
VFDPKTCIGIFSFIPPRTGSIIVTTIRTDGVSWCETITGGKKKSIVWRVANGVIEAKTQFVGAIVRWL